RPRAERAGDGRRARLRAGLERYLLLRAPRRFDLSVAAAAFRNLPEIERAEPDYVASQGATDGSPTGDLPDDPDFATYQWGFRNTGEQITEPENLPRVAGADIHAADAWAVTTGDRQVVVAILDTGIRTDHPEFEGRIWTNEGEIPGNGIDDDQNGYVDDVSGWNFVANDPSPYDDGGHGTACAGIVAANANNGSLVAGLDWSCRLMPVKVLSAAGSGTLSGIAQAIVYAAENGADVISMSLGGYGLSSFLSDACEYAHDSGVFLAAAMMNDDSSQPSYPAAFDAWVTAVGSTDPADQRCTPEVSGYGSNYGPHIDVVAPGVSIPVLWVGAPTGVTLGAGTSFATPMVAGLASLLLSARNGLAPDQVRDLIRYSAADGVGRSAEDTPGFDVYHGWGRIDCGRALALAATTGFPRLAAPASVRGVEGAPIEFEVTVSDPDGDPIDSLKADLATLPSGPSFTESADHARGLFAWTPSYLQSGVYVVRFTAKNPFETNAVTSVEILDVPDPPTVTVPTSLIGTEGTPLAAEISANDPDGDPLTSFTSGPLPAGASFTVEPGLARGVLAWTPGHAQAGDYAVTFDAESLDPAGPLGTPLVERGSAILRIVIREGPDQPPVLSAPARVDAAEGAFVSVGVAASDADGDPIGSLSASPLPTGATFTVADGNGAGTLAWTPGFSQAGAYEIRLAAESAHRASGVSDPVVTETSALLALVVADTPRPPVALPGGPYAGVVGAPIAFDGTASSDPDGTPLAFYRWDFGDGTAGSGAAPAHAYAAGGRFGVTLVVSDGALEAAATTSATVSDLFTARAFPDPQDRSIRLLSAKPTACLHVEAVGGSFEIDAVDYAALSLLSEGTGEVDRIEAIAGKGSASGDADRNGIPDLAACFAKADLRRLFSGLAAGRRRVPVTVEAPLTTGGRLRAELELEVVVPGGALAATVTPNPVRAGGVLSFRSASRGAARVRLFDASGRLVRVLAPGAAPASGSAGGYVEIPFDGRDESGRPLRSGIYFYRVESGSGGGEAAGRLVLVR
ncbi:MAG TPA: S8 family serine peptidase, partial [Candidatus Eisenbacteria bacterium]|nr:S8 family serine peptidase [Candidatus Eisenbacteria bacterium]